MTVVCSRLQAAAVAFGEKLPIPEIVAIGGQSDGKSSLLEAFLGFRFNVREVEMGTRRSAAIHQDPCRVECLLRLPAECLPHLPAEFRRFCRPLIVQMATNPGPQSTLPKTARHAFHSRHPRRGMQVTDERMLTQSAWSHVADSRTRILRSMGPQSSQLAQ